MSPKAMSHLELHKVKPKTKSKLYMFVLLVSSTVFLLLMVLYLGVDLIEANEMLLPRAAEAVPKPFGLTYRNDPPSGFTTENYNQYHYRHPSNIQEVIKHAKRHRLSEQDHEQASTQHVPHFTKPNDSDPFYSYKPQEPGDVNLLATTSLRFAPPIWRNLKRNSHKVPQNHHEKIKPAKPISLVLNIYPNDGSSGAGGLKFGLKEFLNRKIHDIGSKVRFPDREGGKKMTIHLNLYPDQLGQENV